MSAEVVYISDDTDFIEVARKMKKFDIRHLPVVSGDRHLVGIITQRMLYQIHSPRKLDNGEWYYDEEMLRGIILRNVMEKKVISLHADLSMGEALLIMATTRCGGIPIIDRHNKLVGIVTRKDILKSLATIYKSG